MDSLISPEYSDAWRVFCETTFRERNVSFMTKMPSSAPFLRSELGYGASSGTWSLYLNICGKSVGLVHTTNEIRG